MDPYYGVPDMHANGGAGGNFQTNGWYPKEEPADAAFDCVNGDNNFGQCYPGTGGDYAEKPPSSSSMLPSYGQVSGSSQALVPVDYMLTIMNKLNDNMKQDLKQELLEAIDNIVKYRLDQFKREINFDALEQRQQTKPSPLENIASTSSAQPVLSSDTANGSSDNDEPLIIRRATSRNASVNKRKLSDDSESDDDNDAPRETSDESELSEGHLSDFIAEDDEDPYADAPKRGLSRADRKKRCPTVVKYVDEKGYMCDVCSNAYRDPSRLAQHKHIHGKSFCKR